MHSCRDNGEVCATLEVGGTAACPTVTLELQQRRKRARSSSPTVSADDAAAAEAQALYHPCASANRFKHAITAATRRAAEECTSTLARERAPEPTQKRARSARMAVRLTPAATPVAGTDPAVHVALSCSLNSGVETRAGAQEAFRGDEVHDLSNAAAATADASGSAADAITKEVTQGKRASPQITAVAAQRAATDWQHNANTLQQHAADNVSRQLPGSLQRTSERVTGVPCGSASTTGMIQEDDACNEMLVCAKVIQVCFPCSADHLQYSCAVIGGAHNAGDRGQYDTIPDTPDSASEDQPSVRPAACLVKQQHVSCSMSQQRTRSQEPRDIATCDSVAGGPQFKAASADAQAIDTVAPLEFLSLLVHASPWPVPCSMAAPHATGQRGGQSDEADVDLDDLDDATCTRPDPHVQPASRALELCASSHAAEALQHLSPQPNDEQEPTLGVKMGVVTAENLDRSPVDDAGKTCSGARSSNEARTHLKPCLNCRSDHSSD